MFKVLFITRPRKNLNFLASAELNGDAHLSENKVGKFRFSEE